MTETVLPYRCPRRAENPASAAMFPNGDTIRDDGTCSYCGSLSADVFMAHLEAGDVTMGPTDKSYKVYVEMPEPRDGQLVIAGSANGSKPTYGNWERGSDVDLTKVDLSGFGDLMPDHWYLVEPRRAIRHAKFYFQHLSDAQQSRFIELYNDRAQNGLKIGYPGYFYVPPFFCCREEPSA